MLKTIQNNKTITLDIIHLLTALNTLKKRQGRVTLHINFNNKTCYIYDKNITYEMKGF